MNRAKSDDLFNNTYREISVSAETLKLKTGAEFIKNYLFSQTFFYILIGVLVFVLPTMSEAYGDVLTKSTAVILFIIGPLTTMVGTIPLYSKANVAVDNLYKFEHFLDSRLAEKQSESALRFEDFRQIDLEKIHFAYSNDPTAPGFAVGPFDFQIKRGETIFLIGGNGSGKSTLMKLLVALYRPVTGGISVDGLRLQRQHYANYRELFSVIFSDFHLFDRLYGVHQVDERRVLELLKEMQLDDKTNFENGRFTNLNLSTGQRKRLALIIAMLDDRPILALDEFAADQDPSFRSYFYDVILKELKARGKTVIAITHDDRYFGYADRVVKMEYGKLDTQQT
jgi:putative ATP-binding cassette transporter